VTAIEECSGIEQVIHLRTLHVGPDSLLVAAKVAVRPGEPAEIITAEINDAERRIRASVPIAEHIYLEPDLYEASRQDTTDPAVRAVRTARGRRVGRGSAARDGRDKAAADLREASDGRKKSDDPAV